MPPKPPAAPVIDLAFLQDAQQHLQLAFECMRQAQGYAGDATLGHLVDAWVASCKRLSHSTIHSYQDNARALALRLACLRRGIDPADELDKARKAELVAEGRALRLDALEVGDVEKAIDAIASGRWNAVTCALRRMVRWGNRHGFPGVLTLLPELRRHKAKAVAHRPEEWSRAAHSLHEAYQAADERSRPTAAASLCAVLWGVRRSAVATMEWSQVNLREREARVRDKGKVRIVKLDALGLQVLEQLRRRGDTFVFWGRDEENTHVHPNSLTAHTRRVLRAAGVRLTLHQAGRHAAGCTILALGGVPGDVAAHLGHVDERVTRERYLPPTVDSSRARALLDRAWSKGGGS